MTSSAETTIQRFHRPAILAGQAGLEYPHMILMQPIDRRKEFVGVNVPHRFLMNFSVQNVAQVLAERARKAASARHPDRRVEWKPYLALLLCGVPLRPQVIQALFERHIFEQAATRIRVGMELDRMKISHERACSRKGRRPALHRPVETIETRAEGGARRAIRPASSEYDSGRIVATQPPSTPVICQVDSSRRDASGGVPDPGSTG